MTMARPDAGMMASAGKMWWLWLVTGILWVLISIVILQFDITSAATVGFIVGIMFLVAGIQYIVVGTQVEGWSWLFYVFGGILIVGGVVAMLYPTRTFLAIANILGFIFLLIGVMWMIEAFATREGNEFWWMSLVAGIIMIVMGFWLGGQFLFVKAETLLIFAGIWALLRGIMDVVLSFQVKKLA
ncbi:MAG: HdeD family acid-resistance protein [Acidimicrobiia bacterium]